VCLQGTCRRGGRGGGGGDGSAWWTTRVGRTTRITLRERHNGNARTQWSRVLENKFDRNSENFLFAVSTLAHLLIES
jgi:hypothetical protein